MANMNLTGAAQRIAARLGRADAWPDVLEELERNYGSLRDHFAGQALQGLCVNYPQGRPESWADDLSKASYVYADAMLAAREGK